MTTSKILLKDIVIPAGTVLHEAARRVERCGPAIISTFIGLSDNTFGEFTYFMDSFDREVIETYFGDYDPKAPPKIEGTIEKQSVLPSIVVDSVNPNKTVETTICDSMSGGADEVEGMPRELSLVRVGPAGEVRACYIHSVEVAHIVAAITRGDRVSQESEHAILVNNTRA